MLDDFVRILHEVRTWLHHQNGNDWVFGVSDLILFLITKSRDDESTGSSASSREMVV